jgi:hypothetical protein
MHKKNTICIDCNNAMFNILHKDWRDFRSLGNRGVSFYTYVDNLHLGIKFVQLCYTHDEYEVIDEKKWIMTRLKYGF